MTVRVSVITPAYNRSEYLAEALDSALSQDFDGFEVIVVDDGSTDSTPEVARGYGERIRYHRQENAGQSSAINRGVEMARGDYVAFLDSDDAWLPGKLARQIPLLDADPRVALLYADLEYMDADSRTVEPKRPPRHTPVGEILGPLLRENFIRTPTAVFRRDVFLAEGGYDPSLVCVNDWDLSIRVAIGHRVLHDATPSARYRLHEVQAVRNRRLMAEERVKVLEKHLPRIERDAPKFTGAARRALGSRCLKLARLDLRDGDKERAIERMDRAIALVPGLRLEAYRIRLVESLRGSE